MSRIKENAQGRFVIAALPYLAFACKKDAERFVERIARSNKNKR
jgi:hypothetical protein